MQAREFWMRQPERSIGKQSNNWERQRSQETAAPGSEARSNANADATSTSATKSTFTPSNRDVEESNASTGDQWSRQNSGSSGQGGEALKSVGSAGHPDNCNNECVFHFWRGGCKAGKDCRFCHEF